MLENFAWLEKKMAVVKVNMRVHKSKRLKTGSDLNVA